MEIAVPHVFVIFVLVDGVMSSDKTPLVHCYLNSLMRQHLVLCFFHCLSPQHLVPCFFHSLSQQHLVPYFLPCFALCHLKICGGFASLLRTLPSIAFFYFLHSIWAFIPCTAFCIACICEPSQAHSRIDVAAIYPTRARKPQHTLESFLPGGTPAMLGTLMQTGL